MNKKIAIVGIDSFLKKNYNQILCLNRNGIVVDILTNDTMKSSFDQMDIVNQMDNVNNKILLLKKGLLKRVFQIIKYFYQNRNKLNHIEVYAGGRFAFLYVFFAKIFKIKVFCIERGDISNLDKYDKLTLFSMHLVYRYSDIIIYKELYMKSLLEERSNSKLYLLYNCVSSPLLTNIENKEIEFLWVNRLVKERKIEWVVELLKSKIIIQETAILGVLDFPDKYVKKNINLLKSIENLDNLIIQGYVNPIEYYKKSKFFLFPSEIVFGNNALLEAMSYGVIPIVSNIERANLIIEDGIDGLLFEHTKEGFEKVIKKALFLSNEEVLKMSLKAKEKVKRKFSCDSWCKHYLRIINKQDD